MDAAERGPQFRGAGQRRDDSADRADGGEVRPVHAGVRVLDASGVQHLLWRPLQRTCREEVEELLAVGTNAGKKLDAMVDARRNVVVWEREEDPGWRIDSDSELKTVNGVEWSAGMDWIGVVADTELGEEVRLEG